MPVVFFHRMNAVHLRMCFTIFLMITFSDNAVVMNQNSSYHRIGCNITCSQICQLKAPAHIDMMITQGSEIKHWNLTKFVMMTLKPFYRDFLTQATTIYSAGEA